MLNSDTDPLVAEPMRTPFSSTSVCDGLVPRMAAPPDAPMPPFMLTDTPVWIFSSDGRSTAADLRMSSASMIVTEEVERCSDETRRSGVVTVMVSSTVTPSPAPGRVWACAAAVRASAHAPVARMVFFISPPMSGRSLAPMVHLEPRAGRNDGQEWQAIHPGAVPGARQHDFRVTTTDDRAWPNPRGRAWVTGAGRSPDFRVIAFLRLPGRMRPVASWKKARRSQLRGQPGFGARPTVFPFDP